MSFFNKTRKSHKSDRSPRSNEPLMGSKTAHLHMKDNINYIENALCNTEDLMFRPVHFNRQEGCLLYLATMCDEEKIREDILKPLSRTETGIVENILTSIDVKRQSDLEQAVNDIIHGYVVFLLDGNSECYSIKANIVHVRNMQEPVNEKVVRGSHEGFIENLTLNLQLIRKTITNRNLTVRFYKLGMEIGTDVAIVYLAHIADPVLVSRIDQRIRDISADSAMTSNVVEDYIEDQSFSPFPQLLSTERPDRVSANLMEGRVALFSEGSPTVYIMPVSFFSFYQSPDDYNSRTIPGSFYRIIRFMSLIIAILLPAYYIAVVSFHTEVIPHDIFPVIKGSVQKIPFNPLIEALFMELTIELIREAGVRLPSPLGQTIAIVGGLVIGDAVVNAGLVSNVMIIVVALTALASYVIPSHEMNVSIRILRFIVMFSAALFGFVGIVFICIAILIHLCKMESFGMPYFAPISPFRWKDLKDVFIRLPFWKLNKRPKDAHPQKLTQEYESREWKNDGDQKK